MAVQYKGEKEFIRQPGSTVQFSQDGTATQTIIWRGPTYRIKSFRLGIPKNSPDFPALELSNPPNEINQGAYTQVTAVYGGVSEEISAGYPNEPGEDDDGQDFVTTYSLTYRQTSKVVAVSEGGALGKWRLEYRAPFNLVSYTTKSKQTRVSKSSVAQVASESPRIKLLNAVPLDADANLQLSNRIVESGDVSAGEGAALFGKSFGETGNAKGEFGDTYSIEKIAVDFTRNFNGQSWRNSETWTNIISQGINEDK